MELTLEANNTQTYTMTYKKKSMNTHKLHTLL